MTQVQWRMSGDYFEACNCDIPCPCIFGSSPTSGFCDVAVGWHVNSGKYGEISLEGVNFAMVVHTPGDMGAGNWTVGYFLGETATLEQREAMEAILSGSAGGRMQRIAAITKDFLGIRIVPMHFSIEGKTRSLAIPGILDMQVEAVRASSPDSTVQIVNASGTLSGGPPLTIARSSANSLTDKDLRWDNKGKTSYYAKFEYTS